jgi:hypothetical protein
LSENFCASRMLTSLAVLIWNRLNLCMTQYTATLQVSWMSHHTTQ